MSSPNTRPIALRCVFTAAIAGKHAVCEFARRHSGPGARGFDCAAPLTRAACGELSALLVENARFAVLRSATPRPLTPPERLRIQAGGLAGLRQLLAAKAASPNPPELLRAARARHAALADLPLATVVQAIAAWRNAK